MLEVFKFCNNARNYLYCIVDSYHQKNLYFPDEWVTYYWMVPVFSDETAWLEHSLSEMIDTSNLDLHHPAPVVVERPPVVVERPSMTSINFSRRQLARL
jgi:hypothetical protein